VASVEKNILKNIFDIIREDKKNLFYLLYYSAIEAILVLSIPLVSVFIINSILAHTAISIFVLGTIVIIIFTLVTILQIMKEYIVEKFQQKIFITNAVKISKLATSLQQTPEEIRLSMDKLMNYFFDITSIQKVFPVLVLDGSGLMMKIIVSLLLLLAFNPYLFSIGLFFFVFFFFLILYLGKSGTKTAIARSDAKHSSIYYLQHIPYQLGSSEQTLNEFDQQLHNFVDSRNNMFRIIVKQLTATFIMEGIIFSAFLIVGGYLVTSGVLPIGEFVAAEILVVSIANALKGFVKQIDYIYDIVEGLYKVNKLSISLSEKQ
jgi:ABC-type bacteriocin/lantibiotic exporter with double-glycine peptidase domain